MSGPLQSGGLRVTYDRRILAETIVFRPKTTLGDRLQARQIDNQFKELRLKSAILNLMARLGIPDSVKIGGYRPIRSNGSTFTIQSHNRPKLAGYREAQWAERCATIRVFDWDLRLLNHWTCAHETGASPGG
jgi:hypothetical protein